MGVDPLGGAGVHYWARIAERYRLDLTVVSDEVDPTFGFMTLDWDGRIRMDPSSAYAMQRLIGLKDRYDIAFACDTDHDRHGIVTRSAGLTAAEPLSGSGDRLPLPESPALEQGRRGGQNRGQQRNDRPRDRQAGPQTLRGSGRLQMVRRRSVRRRRWVSAARKAREPSFLRRDGRVWTTDKDGIVPALLSAEITARDWPRSRRAVSRS